MEITNPHTEARFPDAKITLTPKTEAEFPSAKQPDIAPAVRLRFAKQLLIAFGAVAITTTAAHIYQPDNTALAAVYEDLKIGIFPLLTLVVTFYFTHR